MAIIGKNTLTGTASGYDTSASSSLMVPGIPQICPANQILTSIHLGYGDIGGSGVVNIKVALYDVTDGVSNAPQVSNTVTTFTADMSTLTGNSWLDVTGLSVDMSAYANRELAVLVSRPDVDGLGVLSEFSTSDLRHRDTPKLVDPPVVFTSSSTSSYLFALYAVLEDGVVSSLAVSRDDWIRETLGKDGNTNDLWIEYWISQGVPSGSYNDMANTWLGNNSYTGDLVNRWFFWEEATLRS